MISKEQIAKVCHEVNRAYCESFGDYSQTSWENAPQWKKDSVLRGVEFHFDNPGCRPSDLHEAWLKDKVKDGWVYGTVKDYEAKTHPCCMPFHQLSAHNRAKDYIFQAIVTAMSSE